MLKAFVFAVGVTIGLIGFALAMQVAEHYYPYITFGLVVVLLFGVMYWMFRSTFFGRVK